MPANRKLGKTTDQRMAMLRQQVTDFLDKGRMETTVTRAKEIAPLAEKMITLGKEGGLSNYRQACSFITPFADEKMSATFMGPPGCVGAACPPLCGRNFTASIGDSIQAVSFVNHRYCLLQSGHATDS